VCNGRTYLPGVVAILRKNVRRRISALPKPQMSATSSSDETVVSSCRFNRVHRRRLLLAESAAQLRPPGCSVYMSSFEGEALVSYISDAMSRTNYHRRSRGPSCAPIKAHNNIAALYQIVIKGIVSLSQLNA
jgi:hypothetical protein